MRLPHLASLSLAAFLLVLTAASCFKPKSESAKPGSINKPIVMAFVPSTEAESVMNSGEQLAAMLTEKTGITVKPLVATSYVGIVEAMGAGSVQVGWLPPLAYVFAHQRNEDMAALNGLRHGSSTYRGQIVVKADSTIKTLADLKGKRVAFPDQASASGTLYPRAKLVDAGLDPDNDIEVSYAGGHDSALMALMSGSADAACCYDDARTKLTSAYADIMTTTRVLEYTDDIPADNVTLAKSLDPETGKKLVEALLAIAQDEQGKKVLFELYEIEGLEAASDADYDPVRKMAMALNLDIEAEVRKPE